MQISEDRQFTTGVRQKTGPTKWKGHYNFTSLIPLKTYYVRVKSDVDNTFGRVKLFTTDGNISSSKITHSKSKNSNLKETNFLIYPNPFTEKISLTPTGIKDYFNIKVTNLSGIVVYESFHNSVNQTIHFGVDLKSGVYIVQITDKQNIINTFKILKK